MVKRTKFEDYNIAKSYYQAIKLKEKEELLNVELFKEEGSILFVSDNSMTLNFEKKDIPIQGRISSGVKGMNIEDNEKIVFGTQIDKSGYLTIITNKGNAKRIAVAEFGLSARYRKGLRAINIKGDEKIIFANFDNEKPDVVAEINEEIVQIKDIPILSRINEGKKIISKKITNVWNNITNY